MKDNPLYGNDLVSRAIKIYDRFSFFNYQERLVTSAILFGTLIPAFFVSVLLEKLNAPEWLQWSPLVLAVAVLIIGYTKITRSRIAESGSDILRTRPTCGSGVRSNDEAEPMVSLVDALIGCDHLAAVQI